MNILAGRGYVLRARTQPALIIALPFIAFLLYVVGQPWIGAILPIVSALGVIALLGEIVRKRGRQLERRLIREWGGFPTTTALRWSGGAPAARRRTDLERLTGITLPSEADELNDPEAADVEYVAAVRVAINLIGRKTLLQSENISYGVRRNLRAWKPIEMYMIGAAAVVNAAIGWWLHFPLATYEVWIVQFALLLVWLACVSDEWVRDQAQTYSDEFFIEVTAASIGGPPSYDRKLGSA